MQDLSFRELPNLAISEGDTAPSPGVNGVLIYSTVDGTIKRWSGSTWNKLEASTAATASALSGLSANQVPYQNASNVTVGSSDFTWTNGTNTLYLTGSPTIKGDSLLTLQADEIIMKSTQTIPTGGFPTVANVWNLTTSDSSQVMNINVNYNDYGSVTSGTLNFSAPAMGGGDTQAWGVMNFASQPLSMASVNNYAQVAVQAAYGTTYFGPNGQVNWQSQLSTPANNFLLPGPQMTFWADKLVFADCSNANNWYTIDGTTAYSGGYGTYPSHSWVGSSFSFEFGPSGSSFGAPTYTLTLPTTAGASGQVLQTDGTGVTSWISAPAGAPGGSNTQIQYNNAGALGASANFTWDDATTTLGFSSSGTTHITGNNISTSTVQNNWYFPSWSTTFPNNQPINWFGDNLVFQLDFATIGSGSGQTTWNFFGNGGSTAGTPSNSQLIVQGTPSERTANGVDKIYCVTTNSNNNGGGSYTLSIETLYLDTAGAVQPCDIPLSIINADVTASFGPANFSVDCSEASSIISMTTGAGGSTQFVTDGFAFINVADGSLMFNSGFVGGQNMNMFPATTPNGAGYCGSNLVLNCAPQSVEALHGTHWLQLLTNYQPSTGDESINIGVGANAGSVDGPTISSIPLTIQNAGTNTVYITLYPDSALGDGIHFGSDVTDLVNIDITQLKSNVPVVFPAYTTSTLPTGIVGAQIFVSNANGGVGTMAFYNGTNWIDIKTGVTVSV